MGQPTPDSLPVTAEDAPTGGSHPVLANPSAHAMLGTPITGPWREGQRQVWLGMGCFWGAEKHLWELPGVESTSVGYAGGFTPHPTYRDVCTGYTGHAEVVHVVYNPQVIEFEQLLQAALEAHDPTQGNRQGNDVGSQYRSVIYTETAEDTATARQMVEGYAPQLAAHGYGPITTEVAELSATPAGTYYLAEDYHQQYLEKNPGGYCPVHATGVACAPPPPNDAD